MFKGHATATISKEMLVETALDAWTTAVAVGGVAGQIDDAWVADHLDEMVEHLRETEGDDSAMFLELLLQSRDGMLSTVGLAQWADCGFPQVEMGARLAAALLVSDVNREALEAVRRPWRAFMLEVPDGLLMVFDPARNASVPLRRILVSQLTGNPHGSWAYMAWTSSIVTLWRFGVTPEFLLPPALDDSMPDWSTLEVTDEDSRVSSLIGRLIINTCLAMSMPEFTNEAGPGHATWAKAQNDPRRLKGQIRQFRLVKPVVIDLREHVAGYIRGEKRKIEVRSLVRGHFKRQHYGVANASVKVIWREPFWRGPEDGQVMVRPHVFKAE